MKNHILAGGIAAVFAVVSFSSCDHDDIEITEENIIGTWVEDYSDYPYFASEGSQTWTFSTDCHAYIHIYDVFAGDKDLTQSYHIGLFGKDVISLNAEMSDYSGADYKITKLTKSVMEWQLVATKFTPGTIGSEFKHFVRKD